MMSGYDRRERLGERLRQSDFPRLDGPGARMIASARPETSDIRLEFSRTFADVVQAAGEAGNPAPAEWGGELRGPVADGSEMIVERLPGAISARLW